MNTIRWGIIGVGDVTEKKSGPAFYKTEHSSLVAVMRRDEDKVRDYARRHQVDRWYTNADQLINDPEVDAIYVATPPDTHKEYTIRALRAGKPVYVEKPMAMNYAECLEMIRAAEENNQKLFVAYYRRALPYFRKVKELLDQQAIGKILTVDVKFFRPASETDKDPESHTWRIKQAIGGEGYFYDMAPHTLDILDFLLGKISSAKGYGVNRGGYYKVKDTISAVWEFESGVPGTGQWCFVASPESTCDTITIFGTEGEIRFNTFAFQPIELHTSEGKSEYAFLAQEHIQQPLIQTIVDELRGVGECPSTGISGARTSGVMEEILNS